MYICKLYTYIFFKLGLLDKYKSILPGCFHAVCSPNHLCMHSTTYPVGFLAKGEQPDRKELDSLSPAHGFSQHSPHLSLILVITMKSGMQTFSFSDHSLLFSGLTHHLATFSLGASVVVCSGWSGHGWLMNQGMQRE